MDRLAISIGLGLVLSPFVPAQSQVLDQPMCLRCSISVQDDVLLRPEGEDEGSFPDVPSSMAVDSRGRLYFALQSPGELPLVFAPSGRFIQRLGREGDGPGEYRMARRILVLPGDTLAIVDVGSRRISLLSPGYRYLRAKRLVGKTNTVQFIRPNQLVTNAEISSAQAIGFPLHRLGDDGAVINSFGSDHSELRPNDIYALLRHLILEDNRHLWSVTAFYNYRIEAWDSTGRLRATLNRKADWFIPYKDVLNATPSIPPSPTIRSAWIDNQNRLWVLTVIADRNWRRGLGQSRRVEGTEVWGVLNSDQVYDTVVDVIDLRERRLIASQRLDPLYSLGAAPNRIARIVPTPEGGLRVHVGTLLIDPPQP
jgi:hypothetical protein